MAKKARRRVVRGRVVQIDIIPSEGGIVLSVGPLSLWLDLEQVGDLTATLARALEIEREESEKSVQPRRASTSRKPKAN